MDMLKRFALIVALGVGAASVMAQEPEEASNVDPYESFNRKMFAFNNGMDRYVFRPVAVGYQYVVPNRMKRGVGNFFANLYDVSSAANGALQWRWRQAGVNAGRFVVNSTVGVLGLMDVATGMGLPPYRADFGQTLATWGVDRGPYLMVPFFGPRTIRSGTGTIVDTYLAPQTWVDNVPVRNTLYGLELVDDRASLLAADQLLTGDQYIFVRDAYLQQRESFVNGGVVQDDFSDFSEDDAWEEEW